MLKSWWKSLWEKSPSPVLTAVCDCPRCGAAVCAVMYVHDGSLEPIRGAFSAGVPTPEGMATDRADFKPTPAKNEAKEGKILPMRAFDRDFRSQPEA